jgi:hypothetical protein
MRDSASNRQLRASFGWRGLTIMYGKGRQASKTRQTIIRELVHFWSARIKPPSRVGLQASRLSACQTASSPNPNSSHVRTRIHSWSQTCLQQRVMRDGSFWGPSRNIDLGHNQLAVRIFFCRIGDPILTGILFSCRHTPTGFSTSSTRGGCCNNNGVCYGNERVRVEQAEKKLDSNNSVQAR